MKRIKQIKDSTSQLEEKYKKAMVQNAQLDNEKTTIHYEVLYNSMTFLIIYFS